MKIQNYYFLRYLFFIFLSNCLILESISNNKLVLHIDVNKTIICMDMVQGLDLQETVNIILAKHTIHNWDNKNSQSYFDYLSDIIADDNPELSRASEKFKSIRTKLLKDFPAYLKKNNQEMFENYKQEWLSIITILGVNSSDINDLEYSVLHQEQKLSVLNLVIFPSFFELINWLENNYKDRYSIILRTFGNDLPNVIPIIENKTPIKFENVGQFAKDELLLNNNKVDYFNFFNVFNNKHFAIRDDYNNWKSKNFQSLGGKIFVFDANNNDMITMFFDDNADDIYQPIIHPVSIDGSLLDTKELLNSGIIISVNSKEAILDKNYFINKIITRVNSKN